MIRKTFFSIVCAMVVSGCVVGPDYFKPTIETSEWIGSEATQNDPNLEVNTEWWKIFNDPILNELITSVANENLDILIAQARITESRALRGVSRSSLLPSFGASGSYTTQQSSANDIGAQTGLDRRQDFYEAGFDASWEIDLFGGNRRALEAATARLGRAEALRREVILSVIAETARNYIELRGAQKRLSLLNKNTDLQAQTVNLVQRQFEIGIAREVDLARAQAQLENTKALIPNIEAQIRNTAYRLAVLTAKQPGSLFEKLENAQNLPMPDEIIPLGLKSDLLRRRPDIQIVERELAAATAEVGVAVAELYPSFNLTGAFGALSAGSFSNLAKSASETWLFTPFINFPIFEGGRLRANIEVQEARENQALLNYQQTVLRVLEETESALISYAKEQETRATLKRSVEASARSAELANKLYDQGLTDFIDVLDSERELTRTEDVLVQSETNVLTRLIAVYKALGGVWETFEKTKTIQNNGETS